MPRLLGGPRVTGALDFESAVDWLARTRTLEELYQRYFVFESYEGEGHRTRRRNLLWRRETAAAIERLVAS